MAQATVTITGTTWFVNGTEWDGETALAEDDEVTLEEATADNSAAVNTRTFEYGPVTVSAVANLSALSVTGAQSGGDLPVSYTIDIESGVAWGIGTGSKPTAAALRAGTSMTDYGTDALTTSGTVNITLGDGIDETGLNLWMVVDGSDTVVTATGSVPFAIDTKSPTGTLSGTQTGATTATIGLDLTDEAGDVADFAVYPEASTPSEGDIEAGTGAAWSAQDVTLTAGDTNDQSATGLTAETGYKAHAVIVDAQGNKTTLVSTTFTTAAATGGVTPVFVTAVNNGDTLASGGNSTLTSFVANAGNYVAVIVSITSGTDIQFAVSGTGISNQSKPFEGGDGAGGLVTSYIYFDASDAADLVIQNDGADNSFGQRIFLVRVTGATVTGAVTTNASGNQTGSPTDDLASVTSGMAILSVMASHSSNATAATWADDATGNEANEAAIPSAHFASLALWQAASAGTETASATHDDADAEFRWTLNAIGLEAA